MEAIKSEDVRSLLDLVGELRELGDDPAGWRPAGLSRRRRPVRGEVRAPDLASLHYQLLR